MCLHLLCALALVLTVCLSFLNFNSEDNPLLAPCQCLGDTRYAWCASRVITSLLMSEVVIYSNLAD